MTAPERQWTRESGAVATADNLGRSWSALDRALARARATFGGATAGESLGRYLASVREAVSRSVAGGSVDVALPRTALAVRVLERLRRDFVEEVRSETSPDLAAAVEILGALGTIESRLEVGTSDEPGRGLASREALELVVEVAHDMRSPLSAILFLAQTIRAGQSGPVTIRQAQQLGLIATAARGLEEVANDLIDDSRGHDQLIESQPVSFSLSDTLHTVSDVVGPIAEEKGLAISIEAPAVHARLGFPVALHRILLNLASNAVKYTHEGLIMIEAREVDRTRMRFSVADTGPGLPPTVLAHLFEPFRATPSMERTAFSSAGLGLSIARRLVRGIGGELEVITGHQMGTRFQFEVDLPPAE